MAVATNPIERFRESQARSRLKQKTSGGIASIPGRLTRGVVLGASTATAAESGLSPGERFHAEQNRAVMDQQSLGLNPAVERMAANNNISPEVYQQATAQAAALTQQMRSATTMAELQGLQQQYAAMNEELTESGLSAEQLKVVDDARRWIWRGVVDTLPLADDFLLGADFGIGTTIAGGVDAYQWLSGMGNVESHIDSNLKFLAPPPKQLSTADKAGVFRTVMHWGVDVLGSFLLWFVQIGWMIALGLTVFIVVMVGSYCAYDITFALTNSVCLELGDGVINILKAAVISK